MTLEAMIAHVAMGIEEKLIGIRRHLHQHPELSFEEVQTAAFISNELKRIEGMEVIENLGKGTGVMGILRGAKSERTLLLRADIDALPIDEPSTLAYHSLNKGKMHACGHDMHVAWLLGAAMILSALRPHLRGTIKFLFQPAEEVGGSRYLLDDERILEYPKVDAVFAAHAWPSLEVGKIAIAQTYAFGAVKNFKIEIVGKGGHGSWPHKSVDPIAVATQVYSALQTIISRQIDPIEPRVLSIGSIHAGPMDKGNIIPDICTMIGTIRGTKPEVMEQIAVLIEHLSQSIAQGFGAEALVTFDHALDPVKNDPSLVDAVAKLASKIVGESHTRILQEPNLGGEDFSLFTQQKAGVYFFVGASSKEKCSTNALHSPQLILEEKAIVHGASLFAMIALGLEL